MRINGKKTFVSGILHGMSARFGGSAVNGSQLAKQLGDLYIQGERLQYLPPTQPLQYLGVTLTMNLNWKHNFSSAMAKAKGQAEALRSCLGTSGQVIWPKPCCAPASQAHSVRYRSPRCNSSC
jgi:hypothetical protein